MTSITASIFSTGRYSDLVINCKGKEFKVHRAVVCLQSKPLAAAVDGNFKEATTGEIDLDGNEPEIVRCMLGFMYTSDYDDGSMRRKAQTKLQNAKLGTSSDTSSTGPSTGTNLLDSAAYLINAKVYIIADQLDIQPLKVLAMKKYEAVDPGIWSIDLFVASLKLLYEETPKSDRLPREVAVRIAGKNAKELCDCDNFINLCKENGGIAFDILEVVLTADSVYQKACTRCPRIGYMQLCGSSHQGEFFCAPCQIYFR